MPLPASSNKHFQWLSHKDISRQFDPQKLDSGRRGSLMRQVDTVNTNLHATRIPQHLLCSLPRGLVASHVAARISVGVMCMVLTSGTSPQCRRLLFQGAAPYHHSPLTKKKISSISCFKSVRHEAPLAHHLLLILVKPSVPLLRIIQVLGSARVRFA